MTLGLVFWIIMLVWVLFNFWGYWQPPQAPWFPWGGNAILFILLLILGWGLFGAPIRG